MRKLIAVSGGIKSGKDTLYKYLLGRELKRLGKIIDFKVNGETEGELLIVFFDPSSPTGHSQGIIDFNSTDPGLVDWLDRVVHPDIRHLSLADYGKALVTDLFDLNPKNVFGSHSSKEEKSPIRWCDVPRPPAKVAKAAKDEKAKYSSEEFLTYRELLQYFLTDVLRGMEPGFHIEKFRESFARCIVPIVFCNCVRFLNEPPALQEMGFKVIRLTRKTAEDSHESETELDSAPPEVFDAVIDNANMTLDETLVEFERLLTEWGF